MFAKSLIEEYIMIFICDKDIKKGLAQTQVTVLCEAIHKLLEPIENILLDDENMESSGNSSN